MAWRAWKWGLAVTACLLIAAPGNALAQGTALVVTVDGFCICHAPMFVGDAKGIFRKHGVDVRMTFPATGFVSLKDVGTGAAHVAAAAPAVVAQVRAAGTLLTGIFMAFGDATGKLPTDEYLAVVGRKASGLRGGHLEDLKGKKIGVPRGTIAHQYLFYALMAKGLDPIQDVTIQPTPPGEMVKALESGSVDAITIWEPVASQGLRVADTVLVARGGNYIQFLDLRVVSPQYLAANPATLKRYLAAFAEAAQFVRQHPNETTDILMPQAKGLDRATVRTMLGYLKFDLRISKATVDAAQQGFTFAQKIGAMQQSPRFEDMIDLKLLKEVEKERSELFSDLPPMPPGFGL
jgi:sulfonate transport system substrate-binding protein